jgi:hypothetical protein
VRDGYGYGEDPTEKAAPLTREDKKAMALLIVLCAFSLSSLVVSLRRFTPHIPVLRPPFLSSLTFPFPPPMLRRASRIPRAFCFLPLDVIQGVPVSFFLPHGDRSPSFTYHGLSTTFATSSSAWLWVRARSIHSYISFSLLARGAPLRVKLKLLFVCLKETLPFLLRERLSYSKIAVFTLSSYPYSLKLLWSPIVDARFIPSVGRRRSWIIPMQTVLGSLMLWMSFTVQPWINNVSLTVQLSRGRGT